VIGSASPSNHEYLRGLGVEPVPYGRRLVDDVLALAPGGVDAVIDLVGGAALDAVPALLKEGGQLVGVTDALRLKELGGRYLFVHPDAAQLTDLGLLAARVTSQSTSRRSSPSTTLWPHSTRSSPATPAGRWSSK